MSSFLDFLGFGSPDSGGAPDTPDTGADYLGGMSADEIVNALSVPSSDSSIMAGDSAFTNVMSWMGSGADSVPGDTSSAASSVIGGGGPDVKSLSGGKDSSSWLPSWLKSGWDAMDNKTKSLAVMGFASGLPAGYFKSKELAQQKEMEQQKIDTANRLAASQISLNQAKTSGNAAGLTFTPNSGLINNPGTWAPAPTSFTRPA